MGSEWNLVCAAFNLRKIAVLLRIPPRDDGAAAIEPTTTEEGVNSLPSKLRAFSAPILASGWRVNHKRVERIWGREGLKVPSKQPKRGRLWLNDVSTTRLRPARRNHVLAYDVVMDRAPDGRAMRMLAVIDGCIRECLTIRVERRIRSTDVIVRADQS